MTFRELPRVGQGVDPLDGFVAADGFDARKAQRQTALVSRARVNGIERNLEDGVWFYFTVPSMVRDRLLFEMLR